MVTKTDEFKSTTVSAFPDMVSRMQSTVQKPNGGHLSNENLQKSAATKATTMRASCMSSHQTPRVCKEAKRYPAEASLDDFATSEKCTPMHSAARLQEELGVDTLSQRRMLKLQEKEAKKIKQI